MSKSPKPPPILPLPDMSRGLEPEWIDPLVGSEAAYDRQLFADLVDEMVPKLKRSLVRKVLPSAEALLVVSDDEDEAARKLKRKLNRIRRQATKAALFQRLPGLVAGSDDLENMESLDDLKTRKDPEVPDDLKAPDNLTPGAAELELSEALDVAGLSAENDATRFVKAFGKWCDEWHLYNRWQHVAALQALVSMTQGWGAKDGGHKYESLTTLDQWTPRTKGLTPVHRRLALPPFLWMPTKQAWRPFERGVLDRVKAELEQFKKEAEAHFTASRLERMRSKRTDPQMRNVLRFQMEGKTKEVAEAHFGKDELERSLSTPVRHSWELIRERSPVS